jgi:hypothetical protein
VETYARRHGFGVPLRAGGGEKSKKMKGSLGARVGARGGGMFTSE